MYFDTLNLVDVAQYSVTNRENGLYCSCQSSSAIAVRPRCSVDQFWPKYKWITSGRRYFAPNVVGARKLKALITINPLLYEKRPRCAIKSLYGGLATYVVDLRLIGKPIVGFLLVIFSLGVTACLLYTSPSPRDGLLSRMPSSA